MKSSEPSCWRKSPTTRPAMADPINAAHCPACAGKLLLPIKPTPMTVKIACSHCKRALRATLRGPKSRPELEVMR